MSKQQPSDFFKSFSNFNGNAPVDFNELMNVGRRNMEAYSAANQALIDGAQAINKRGAEVMQENVEKCLSASRELMNGTSPQVNTQKQTDIAKDMMESYIASTREISEMVSKTTFEAFDVINKRCAEAVEETTQLNKKAA